MPWVQVGWWEGTGSLQSELSQVATDPEPYIFMEEVTEGECM